MSSWRQYSEKIADYNLYYKRDVCLCLSVCLSVTTFLRDGERIFVKLSEVHQ